MKLISSYLDNTFSFAIIGERMIKLHLVELAIKQGILFLLPEDQIEEGGGRKGLHCWRKSLLLKTCRIYVPWGC